MKSILLLSFLTAVSLSCLAQQKTDKFPLGQYEELTDTKPHDEADVWNKMKVPTMLSWGTTDVRYKKQNVPDIKKNSSFHVKAWRGERVNAQAVIWTNKELKDVTVEVGALKNGKYVIPDDAVKANFVRYVMTDELNSIRSLVVIIESQSPWNHSVTTNQAINADIVHHKVYPLVEDGIVIFPRTVNLLYTSHHAIEMVFSLTIPWFMHYTCSN